MKRIVFIAMAAAAVLCGCQKENLIPQQENEAQTLVFSATIESAPAPIENSPATKATYDSENGCAAWEEDDQISINGKIYSAQESGLTTIFKAVTEGQEAEGPAYNAYFPASLYNGKLPAIQTYKAGKFDMPMYAESTTTSLAFKNLCAVLAIKVTSEDIATLKSIKVASDRKMNGSFTVKDNAAVIGDDGTNVVVLESPTALTLDETGTTFYIYIPAQKYMYFNIFLSSDGKTYTQAMATKKADGLGTIARNQKLNIDYAKNATKLWEGNLFFADGNVDVVISNPSPEDLVYGGYYSWGGRTNKSPADHYEGTGDLSGEDDTATYLWGYNWRMPTSTELDGLINKCTYAWEKDYSYKGEKVNGLLCTSKDAYPSNSIFLPAAGYCDDLSHVCEKTTMGSYWTSSAYKQGARRLYFDEKGEIGRPEGFEPWNDQREVPYSVRAMLVEQ